MKINREMKNINGLINFNLCHSMILWFWMKILISDFFFFFEKKEGHNQKVIAIYISNEIEERETHTHARCRISSGGFQRKLVHGNASSSWISRLLSRRNNSLYLCHPPILPTLLFSTTPYFISFSLLFTSLLPPFFSNSYYSSRIIFFLFFLFFFLSPLSLQAHWKNTSKGGNNSFLASWNSFNQSVLFSKITFITFYYSGTAMLLQKRKL